MLQNIWAATRQNQQCGCAPSEDSDQPGHPPSLIRVFAVRMKKAWVLSYPLSAQRRLWSDWAHSHFVGFVMSRFICFFDLPVIAKIPKSVICDPWLYLCVTCDQNDLLLHPLLFLVLLFLKSNLPAFCWKRIFLLVKQMFVGFLIPNKYCLNQIEETTGLKRCIFKVFEYICVTYLNTSWVLPCWNDVV